MKQIPDEAIKKISDFCEENDLGMLIIMGTSFQAVVIGDEHPDAISLQLSNSLITSVLRGEWRSAQKHQFDEKNEVIRN